jgi:hypothetical protein
MGYLQGNSPKYLLIGRLGGLRPVWMRWRREKVFLYCPCRESNLGPLARILVTVLCCSMFGMKVTDFNGIYFVSHTAPFSTPDLGPSQPPTQWVSGVLSPEVKRLGREAHCLPPSLAEVKNACGYTSTRSYVFVSFCLIKHGDTFTLPLRLFFCASRRSSVGIVIMLRTGRPSFDSLQEQ